ncbi:MAG: ABC transporter permease [Bacteroidetes bacterium]|nr:ABC transporter permease [Bacteroidota bacterium]MBU2559095.1 ABC transporter permease [Bacteroidota bacterium]
MERYWEILQVALEAVFANRSRSILTALGIIFGVAAVIAMMAIGKGAQQEILDQIKLVGVNNIIVQARFDVTGQNQNSSEEDGQQQQKQYSPGLTLLDALSIGEIIPTVTKVSPEVSYETSIIKDGKRQQAKLNGITPDFFEVFNLNLASGTMFSESQLEAGSPICIIGPAIKTKFFPLQNPIGQQIKCGNIWLRIVGVLENKTGNIDAVKDIGISDFNNHIYAPIQTVLLRFKDRARINEGSLNNGGNETVVFSGNSMMSFSSSSSGSDDANYHQLDRIVVQVEDSELLNSTTKILQRMLKRKHFGVEDFEITVPELLLKQEQRTKDIFNIVLGAIAGISLLVGGIGIMNIMLASVMERIREIGVRRSIGATKRDIIFQFLSEATLISISGGLFGILLGVIMAKIITETTEILTIVSPWSIVISFGVAASVGIVFGYLPARKAAQQDPVTSLRHD